MTALASRIGRIQRWRNEIDNPGRGGRLVCLSAVLAGWDDDRAGEVEPWPDGKGCYMVVGAEHAADPVRGLSDAQRRWLRTGDHIEVGSPFGWDVGDGAMFMYAFYWPGDPGPPGPALPHPPSWDKLYWWPKPEQPT